MTTPYIPLPEWAEVPVSSIQNLGNKLPASRINDADKKPGKIPVSAENQLLPVVYGRNRLDGRLADWGLIHQDGTDFYYLIPFCYGECEEIEQVYINNQPYTDFTGVTMTPYVGTDSQTVDPVLQGLIAGYNDDLPGVCYAVVKVPNEATSGVSGWPVFSAIIKGRKVYDPRSTLTEYSTNPALCLADFMQNDDFGEGKLSVLGVSECADFCDEQITGENRCEINFVIYQSKKARDYSLLLAEYAECFVIEEGDDIRIRPDTVGDPVAVYTDDDIIDGSLSAPSDSITNAPTVIELTYTLPKSGGAAWSNTKTERFLAGVGTSLGRTVSSVSMSGLHRETEANRKAESRLRRAQLATSYQFDTFDHGVLQQVGDIVTLDSSRKSIMQNIRITSVSMVALGRYRIRASVYDPSGYPDSVAPPASTTNVPVGAILISTDDSTPAGWQEFSANNDLLIVGAGGSYTLGQSIGDNSVLISGDTSDDGTHTGNVAFFAKGGNPASTGNPRQSDNDPAGGHTHSYSETIDLEPSQVGYKLIEKIGTESSLLPSIAGVMRATESISSGRSAITDTIGRIVGAASSKASFGSNARSHSITLSAEGQHKHGGAVGVGTISGNSSGFLYEFAVNHTHGTVSVDSSVNIKRRRLLIYSASEDYELVPGDIILFNGASIPIGFELCDGLNGTVDMRDYVAEVSAIANAGTTAGDNTVSYSGETGSDGAHSHQGTLINNIESVTLNHNNTGGDRGGHTHSINGSASYIPESKAINFIMYTGA